MPLTTDNLVQHRAPARGRRAGRAAILALALAALVAAPGRAHAEEGWELVTREDGITVTKRDVPGRGFPTFRATGMVEAHVYDVLAVISDIPAYTKWQTNCIASRELKKLTETSFLVYTRTHAPWPVADRDAVYHATVHPTVKQKMIVEVRFSATKTDLQPPVKGVVRMEKMRGYFRLTELGPRRTLVDYHVDGDPGGLLPTWLAKLAVKRVPLDAIQGMRRRAAATRGQYDERIKKWKEMEAELRK
jgi:hypothetical protein